MTPSEVPAGAASGFARDPARPDVWVIDNLSEAFLALAERGPASDEDRARASSLTDLRMRRTVLARRSALRWILARYLGRDPTSVRIVTAPGGKPSLVPERSDDLPLSFSATHSGDLFCVAVTVAHSVGLDVERQRSVPRALSIASRWFSANEAARLHAVHESERDAEFVRLWTAKEALAKRHGAGLRLLRGREGELDIGLEAEAGTLAYFSPRTGYAGALASSQEVEDVRCLHPGADEWTI